MNALVKKEIRLLWPSWIVAVLLALVQGITQPYDFYVASLLFFGLTIMALTTIGRETSLNTFSSLLAQPAERLRIWQTKLSVLAVAFLTVFAVWLAAFGLAFINSNVDASDRENSYNLFITICLIATATFTGGLWTTLLLRQLAGAFWLTLLVPATLSGFSGVFLADSESSSLVIAVLSVVIGVYSIAGFLLARWLFFRAQDVGWSGGIIALPEWKFLSARDKTAEATRSRKPLFTLLKKELQLQQGVLTGAIGLLVLHVGIVVLRAVHHFRRDSAGEILTSIFWMLWLVLPVIIGSIAVAEERKFGVMESQLCLPVSRRVQFAIKTSLTLFLGIFLGGVMPILLESAGYAFGTLNPAFSSMHPPSQGDLFELLQASLAVSVWFVLVSYFASSLAKNFLQAIGFAVATFVVIGMCVPLFTERRMFFFDTLPAHSLLPLIMAVPTLIVTLLTLAYKNYKNFRDGWPLWGRNLLGVAGALVLIAVASSAIYNRAWEAFRPAEPEHGPAKFTLADPPVLHIDAYNNEIVRLPDGRIWCDYLSYPDVGGNSSRLKELWVTMVHPFLRSAGAHHFLAGSNYTSVVVRHVEFETNDRDVNVPPHTHIAGYLDTVAVKADGTLWVSEASTHGEWTGDKMDQFGSDAGWRQVARDRSAVLLLKNDGTLWHWGAHHIEPYRLLAHWPSLLNDQPEQIGTNNDWKEFYDGSWANWIRKADGSVGQIVFNDKSWEYQFERNTNLDEASFKTLSLSGSAGYAYVRADGTLWINQEIDKHGTKVNLGFVQVGTDTNWAAVALMWNQMAALKSDGSLWRWNLTPEFQGQYFTRRTDPNRIIRTPPIRVGIHSDWVAIGKSWNDVVALAADGSLWLWPNHQNYDYERDMLIKLPKQPQFLGNVFGPAD